MKWHRKTSKTAMLLRKPVLWQVWQRSGDCYSSAHLLWDDSLWGRRMEFEAPRQGHRTGSDSFIAPCPVFNQHTILCMQTPFLEFAVLSRRWIDRWPWAITVSIINWRIPPSHLSGPAQGGEHPCSQGQFFLPQVPRGCWIRLSCRLLLADCKAFSREAYGIKAFSRGDRYRDHDQTQIFP